MGISLTDVLLRHVCAERSDAYLVKLAAGSAVLIPKSFDVVAHYVIEGRITIETGNSMELPATLRDGEFALLFYGNEHRISLAGAGSADRTHIIREWPADDEPSILKFGKGKPGARFISAALRIIHHPSPAHRHNPMPDIVHLKRDAKELFGNRIVSLEYGGDEAAFHGSGAGAFINAIMNLHLTHAFRCANFGLNDLFPEMAKSPYLMRSERTRAVATAVRLLNTHPAKDWTIARLASEVGQSRSVFAEKFRAYVGSGPMEYLAGIRLKMAADLMIESNFELPLSEIAQLIGYSAASSFARAFKGHYGVSPRLFAKQRRSNKALSPHDAAVARRRRPAITRKRRPTRAGRAAS
jgi:AraC-like DNA-binding protein